MGTFAFALFFVLPVLLHLAFDFAVSVSVFFFEFVAAMFLALTFSLFLVFAVFLPSRSTLQFPSLNSSLNSRWPCLPWPLSSFHESALDRIGNAVMSTGSSGRNLFVIVRFHCCFTQPNVGHAVSSIQQ